MVTKATTNAVWKNATLLYGTAGTTAATSLGYIGRDGGLEIALPKEVGEYFVDDLPGPAILQTVKRDIMVRGSAVQFHTDALEIIMGLDAASGNQFDLSGDDIEDKQFSLKVTVARRDGETLSFEIPYCQGVGETTFAFSRESLTEIPFEFRGVDVTDSPWTMTNGYNATATLASGVLTRTADEGYHLVAGEGGAADTLDSITGTSLTDNEYLKLQIADADDPITLTHLAGTLELTGEVDWTMDDAADWILLQYDSAGTKWEEVSRYDA